MRFFYSLSGQRQLSTEAFIEKINSTPQKTTWIDSSLNDFGSKTGTELAETFCALPQGMLAMALESSFRTLV